MTGLRRSLQEPLLALADIVAMAWRRDWITLKYKYFVAWENPNVGHRPRPPGPNLSFDERTNTYYTNIYYPTPNTTTSSARGTWRLS